jgi:hypothetical protein
MSKQDQDNDAHSQAYHDARNEENPITRLANDIAYTNRITDRDDIRYDGYQKGLEDRAEDGPQTNEDDSSSSQSSSGCFITTACVTFAGLADDCTEMRMMRRLRDEYVGKLPIGPALIQEYYATAPALVERINKLPNRVAVLNGVLNNIRRISEQVASGSFDEAYLAYRQMFVELRTRV